MSKPCTTKTWGRRCPDYHSDCVICQAWNFHDLTGGKCQSEDGEKNLLTLRLAFARHPERLHSWRTCDWVRFNRRLFLKNADALTLP